MKTILIVISLTFFYAMATGQNIYYGASIGVVHGKYFSPKKQIEKVGIYDAYLHGLVGYTKNDWLAETNIGATASLQPMVELGIGRKIDFGENVGLHFLVNYRDEIMYSPHPLQITHYFYPTLKTRIWIGTFMVQGTFIKKQSANELELGIGVIGF